MGNLNADLLDGFHENSFLRHRDTYGIDGYNTLWSQIGIRQYNNAKPDGMANPIYDYGAVISLPGKNTRLDIWYNHTSSASDSPTNGIQYRSGFNDDKKPWRMLLDNVNYASYSDGRYVKKAGDTMTGDLNISGGHILYMLQTSSTSTQQIHFQGGRNDYGRIAFGGTAENAGWMEIASCDDGNEPIYARQYTGVFTTIKRTATLLDASGNTSFPGSVTSVRHISTVGTGTAPYQCSSTTLNTNLNADLLDGEHGAYYQNRMYDNFISQYNNYNYIEFLRFVIPSGQNLLRAYVIFDLCRVETGGEMSGRVVLRIRRGTDNNAGYAFYVTNFGRSWLPELRCTTNDGITWRVWMKCVKTTYDPYIAVKIVEKYPYGYVTTQNNGTTDTPSGSKYTFTASMAGLSNAANILVNTRNIFGQPFNGSGDVGGQMTSTSIFVQTGDATLKVYSGRITDAISDGNICLQTSIDGTDGQSHSYPTQYQSRCNLSLQPRGGQVYIGQNPDGGDTGYKLTVNGSIKSNGNIIATGAVTAQSSSSDRRLKRNICDFSASDIIRKLHPKTFYWNETAKRLSPALNHDKLNYGLIAQDVESMPELPLFASNIFGDYLILQYEKFIPILIQGVKEVDDEVTRLKKRVKELENKLGINN